MSICEKLNVFIDEFNQQLTENIRFRAIPKSSRIREEVVKGVLLPLARGFDKAVEENDANKIMKYALMMYRTLYHEFRRIKYYGSGLPYDCFISQPTVASPSPCTSENKELEHPSPNGLGLNDDINVSRPTICFQQLLQLEIKLDFPGKLVEFRQALQAEMRSSHSVQEELADCLDNVPTGALDELTLSGDWKCVNIYRSRHGILDNYLDEHGHVKEGERIIKRGPGYGFWTTRTCLKNSYKLEIERDDGCQLDSTL